MIYIVAFIAFVCGLGCGWKWREHKARELIDMIYGNQEHAIKVFGEFKAGKQAAAAPPLDKSENPTPE